ncbi:MAG TPA: prepilin-type N-terminal cleavage/methylation domain-containing protein [Planctomycetes bacterium]|nr:prepilin-type N-terminal cleavage/methylation domain-containing protein [Planctomycetota bacterium]
MTFNRVRGGKRGDEGFSLLEVLVAVAILAVALLSLAGLRTDSLVTATSARNLRIAQTFAKRILAQVQSGQFDAWELRGTEHQIEEIDGFSYRIFIGEGEIQEELSRIAEDQADETGSEQDQRRYEKLDWIKRRRMMREARDRGEDTSTLDTATTEEPTDEDEEPDEETYEDIGVFVYYFDPKKPGDLGVFSLRGRASTLALSGLTPDEVSKSSESPSGPGLSGGEKKE